MKNDNGLTGAEVIVKTLEKLGVEVMFGTSGHTNLAVLDAVERSSIKFYGVRHEQVATHAADGYFRATRKVAAVLTTIGPGLTNSVTGMGDAALDGAGMIVISGDVPSYFSARGGFQELNLHGASQTDLVRPIVKRAWNVSHRESLGDLTVQAYQQAVAPTPGPVVLNVPMDLFSERSDAGLPTILQNPSEFANLPMGDHAKIRSVAHELFTAQRPVIYAGGGAAASPGIRELLTTVAEHLGVPVVTTLSGQGVLSKSHDLYAGYTATVGVRTAHELVNNADLILVLGSQLAEMETSSFRQDISFKVPPSRLIQVDIDATRIGRYYPVHEGIVADVGVFLRQLHEELQAITEPTDWRSSERFLALQRETKGWNSELLEARTSNSTPIGVDRLLGDIREALPEDGIFLTDVGIRHQVAQQFDVPSPQNIYVGSGFGTMGGVVAAAIGAKIGRPDRAVIAEVGDGAFTSVLSAVVSAVEFSVPVVWIVMNNFSFSSINIYQSKHDLGGLGTAFTTPDGKPYNPNFAEFARACGGEGRVVTNPDDLLPALKEALRSNKPTVLDVHTDPEPRVRASGWWDVNRLLANAKH